MGEMSKKRYLVRYRTAPSDSRPIDYDLLKLESPRLKRLLEEAKPDPIKVQAACREAVEVWDRAGCWPDNWTIWVRALEDSLPWAAGAVDFDDIVYRRADIVEVD